MDNPKIFWRKIENVFPSTKGKSGFLESIKSRQKETITDNFFIAKKFKEFFSSAVFNLMKTVWPPQK